MKLPFDPNQTFQLDAVAGLFDGQAQGAPEYAVINLGDMGGLFAGQNHTTPGSCSTPPRIRPAHVRTSPSTWRPVRQFLKLRTTEADKVRCGQQHFEAIGVPFAVAVTADDV